MAERVSVNLIVLQRALTVAWLGCSGACGSSTAVPDAVPNPSVAPGPSEPTGAAAPGPSRKGGDDAPSDSRIVAHASAHGGAVPPRASSELDPKVLPCSAPPEGMVCIPGGSFVRGTDDGPANTRPQAEVWLQTFFLDQYEVTFGAYKACEASGECPRAGPQYTDFNHPRMPIQGVSWFDAMAYCRAQGKTLPTEAQWEKAARGVDGHLYPWGDEEPTCERAILRDASGRACGLPKAYSKPEVGRPWDVGSRPAGVYALYDMIGNSWEWVADWYSRDYAQCGAACMSPDPKGPCAGAQTCPGHAFKLVRGGSWYWDKTRATGVYRRPHHPDNQPFHHFGFRCAREP